MSYPFWTDEELVEHRAREIAAFVAKWDATLGARYRALAQIARAEVERLFDESEDLRLLKDDPDFLAGRRQLLAAACACAAPYVSEDNYKVLSGALGSSAIIASMLDRLRFPWATEQQWRGPTADEREHAISSTSIQMAARRQETELRVESAREQERLVREHLTDAGLNFVPSMEVRERLDATGSFRPDLGIEGRNLDIALQRGDFTSEFLCAGMKADVPVRAPDGRLLAIEAKVSNSATNSTKRLIREVVGKEGTWRQAFGQDTLVAGFITGVFSLKNLKDAQAKRTLLFFQSDADALDRFVAAGFQPRPAP